jgi:hypothetical protein
MDVLMDLNLSWTVIALALINMGPKIKTQSCCETSFASYCSSIPSPDILRVKIFGFAAPCAQVNKSDIAKRGPYGLHSSARYLNTLS